MRKLILAMVLMALPGLALAAPAANYFMSMKASPHDKPSLQRGANHFVNYCLSCHQAELMRYKRVADDLGIPEDLMMANLVRTPNAQIHDTMRNAMRVEDAEQWFGAPPPDLSLYVRRHGADRLYSFLNGYYRDESRPWGVNNLVVSGVSMPHVLEILQGLPEPVFEERGAGMAVVGVQLSDAARGLMTEREYLQFTRDLTNFLDYVAEPVKAERERIGAMVIIFLLIFFVLAYLLKLEYWKDVH
jgi:ubiquinol-cytochrome c reductase cytochrome c1 subunit